MRASRADDGAGARSSSGWRRALQIAIAAALLFLMFWKVDPRGIGEAMTRADPRLVLVAVAVNVPIAMLFAARSHVVLRRLGFRTDVGLTVTSSILGNVAASLTPASSGELLRIAALRAHAGMTAEDGAALVLYERALSAFLLCAAAGVTAAWVTISWEVALAIGVAVCGLVWLLPVASRFLPDATAMPPGSKSGPIARAWSRVSRSGARLGWILADRRLVLSSSLFTVLTLAAGMCQFWILARAVSGTGIVTPSQAALAFCASQLAGQVSLLPLGIGASDATLSALLIRAGLRIDQGSAVALLVRVTSTLPLGLACVVSQLYLARGTAARRPAPYARDDVVSTAFAPAGHGGDGIDVD